MFLIEWIHASIPIDAFFKSNHYDAYIGVFSGVQGGWGDWCDNKLYIFSFESVAKFGETKIRGKKL